MVAADLIPDFALLCRRRGLSPSHVLQAFAGHLSLDRFLFAGPGALAGAASAVMSRFCKVYQPEWPLLRRKQQAGILYVRRLLKLHESLCLDSCRVPVFEQLSEEWYGAEGLEGAGVVLLLGKEVYLSLTTGFLVVCDIWRCRPETLLCFFMVDAVEGEMLQTERCVSLQFLEQVAGNVKRET